MSKFKRALADRAEGERVVVLWLGDSHTHADIWSHAVRASLQGGHGRGGPGFLSIGLKPYRHSLATVKVEGKWKREPTNPSTSTRFDDGVFGLGGQRAVALSSDARASVTLSSGAVQGQARFTLLFRNPKGARFTLDVPGSPPRVVKSGATIAGSTIERVEFQSDGAGALVIRDPSGEPQFFGLIVESSEGGVVVDTLGVNGARAATALSWDEAVFIAEVRARRPKLAVIAYGTNEAASALAAARYQAHLTELVARLRRAEPNLGCVVVGPTDMALPDGSSRPRVAEFDAVASAVATEVGCAFFSAQEAMGGPGGFTEWMRKVPPLASHDRVHLTAQGYQVLGRQMLKALGL